MKHLIYSTQKILLACSVFAAVSVVSCKKGLQTEPYSYFTSSNFFANENEAYLATLGVYEIMSNQPTYGFNMPLIFDNDTDVGQTEGVDLTTDFRVIAHYNGVPESTAFYTTWSAFYAGIDRANVVIEKIPAMELFTNGTTSQKDQLNRMLAEAKFLRGFYYAELVRFWGDVPFKLKSSQTGDNFKVSRTDRYEIYAQIIKDMQEAILVLPTALPVDERINKWAAKAMLAKIALFAGGYSLRQNEQMERPANFKEYYTLAKQQIDDIMAVNPYRLNPNYAQVFKNQCQHVLEPTENIFQVAFLNASGSSNGGNAQGNIFGSPVTAVGVYAAAANSRIITLKSFYDGFRAADVRRDFSIANYTINAKGEKLPQITARQDETWRAAKWSREYQTGNILENSSTHINAVLMRYSDLLLMRAEVENELSEGPNATAYDAINQVRRRGFGIDVPGTRITIDITAAGTGYTAPPVITITGGGGTGAAAAVTTLLTGGIRTIFMMSEGDGYTSLPTVTVTSANGVGTGAVAVARFLPKPVTSDIYIPAGLNKADFLKAVQQERAWELAFEGTRRADLIRWNILGTTIKETDVKLRAIRSNYNYTSAANFIAGKHELYPIPQNEKDVNPNVGQNPKY
ncbi:RagB/SusD family nutrient uptake outer membrane protein [Pedobacter heparinus]|uniref:RagB/SusD family nutrient uptake outer membrane protein n=1 Tax=Pedobacter heparinus TaxID=984 RepID=UPI0029307757|nr:RagB/SusD family nutrient uptake outer membrane protein [Pedobacter heparinus]